MAEACQRLVLAYQRPGFTQVGGLRRIATTVAAHLSASRSDLALATLCTTASGVVPHTRACRQLQPGDQLLIVGCDSPWAYGLALRARLRGLAVSWMPSFHDPRSAIHGRRARLAQLALRALQTLGIVVYVQTQHEAQLLQAGGGSHCRLSGHGLPAQVREALLETRPANDHPLPHDRPIDLLFLGRPTPQKGWPLFLALAHTSGLRCEAIVPFQPAEAGPITLHRHPSDAEVAALLAQAKLVVIPANYESFGIAQLEALIAGCVVPILGHWPLWSAYPELQWQQLSVKELARQCLALSREPELRQRLLHSQLAYLRQHPVLSAPILPGLP